LIYDKLKMGSDVVAEVWSRRSYMPTSLSTYEGSLATWASARIDEWVNNGAT
jgi:hypothetical protein